MKTIVKLLFVSILAISTALLATACGGGNTKPGDNKSGSTSDNKTTSTPTTAGGGEIGVPECDDYIKKYEMCLNSKVPEAARGAFKTSLDQVRKSWKEAAANPQTKAALASGCKTALETAKQSLSAYSCEW